MALALGFKDVHEERRALKWIFGTGIFFITLFLAITNATGAWVATKSWAFTGLAIGAEIALVAAFSLIVLGETKWRQGVGIVVFCGLAWFCVENGKAAVKHWMADVFIDAPAALRSRADLADAEAKKLDSLPTDTKTEATEQRRLDREELAALRVEQKQMQAQDEQGIIVAQTALKAQGKYKGVIDGIRADLTEAAMVQRGAEIEDRIKVLQAKLDEGGAQDAAVSALAPAQTKREEAITLRTQADEAGFREWWAQILLLVAEAARSFGVWAFLMAGTRESARYGRRKEDREEDKADAAPEQERKVETEGGGATEKSQPAEASDQEAETQAEETQEASDLGDEDPAIARARAGGDANAQARSKEKVDTRIPVGDWRDEALRTAAE